MKTIVLKTLLAGVALAATTALAAENYYPATTTLTPQSFVTQASFGNEKEVALSQMALDKSQNPAVRQFAERMVRDHSRANQKLTMLADRKGLDCSPTNCFAEANWNGLNIENPKGLPARALMMSFTGTNADFMAAKYLNSLSGAEFDRAYADCMVKDHQDVIQKFTDAAQNLQDTQLKNYASRMLPTLNEHLRMAEKLQGEVNGTKPDNTSYPMPAAPPTTPPSNG